MKQKRNTKKGRIEAAAWHVCPYCTKKLSPGLAHTNGNGEKKPSKRASWTIGQTWRMDPQPDGKKKKVWFDKVTGKLYVSQAAIKQAVVAGTK